MLRKLIKAVTGDAQTRRVKQLRKQITGINDLADEVKQKSDSDLKARISEIKEKIQSDEMSVEEARDEVFAITREIAARTVDMRPFDVQLMGGIVMHEGDIAEMRTGEGKTLVATLPMVLNALEGKGAHLVTVNDYLAKRDAGWMAQVYDALGLSVGVIASNQKSFRYNPEFTDENHDDERLSHLQPCSRKEAYACDITYGTNNEFGFDYLRDNMASSVDNLVQRGLHYAIVDEVDSVLIDEARTPLIISAPASASSSQYENYAEAVKKLKPKHYDLDEKQRQVALNDDGVDEMQSILGIDNLYDPSNVQAVYHLDQALRAETLFKKDRDYVINDGEVVIVDEFTGRLMEGRRYSEGLHQAIEAKEGVSVLQESMTLATISFQNLFRLYDKLAGMTGTAETEKEEFYTIYKLDVAVIPTNMPIARDDLPDRIYKTEKGKYGAIVDEVKERSEAGQPVLIGTVSVDKNEYLSKLLDKAGVSHEVLNAKNNEREAAIVEEAGQAGAVTLATNIAGRGTDIKLGEGVVKAGGLHVMGTERHESRRIDNQLRGRAGRQGDPGSTQFYVSTDDDMMRIFGGDRMKGLMERMGVDEKTPIENKTITKQLEKAQKKVEDFNYDRRKNVVQYDDVMNRHRKAIYSLREEILRKDDITELVQEILQDEIDYISTRDQDEFDPEAVLKDFRELLPVSAKEAKQLLKDGGDSQAKLSDVLTEYAQAQYAKREEAFTPEIMRQMERQIYLKILDDLWMQHLENMQHLREGIGLRRVGQRDPLVEYRREGQVFFEQMMADIRNGAIRMLFRSVPRRAPVEGEAEPEPPADMETELTKAAQQAKITSGGTKTTTKTKKSTPKNQPRKGTRKKNKTQAKGRKAARQRRKKDS